MATEEIFRATGRRKTSIASVRLIKGDGTIKVNDRDFEEYFPRETLRSAVIRPLVLTEKKADFSVISLVNGGGVASQAGALAHGISRALLKFNGELRGTLKKEGLLTRDDRMKERKKYGQKGARKRFQFSKR